MQMIEVDNFWHLKTFEAVLTDLQRRWDDRIHEQKDVSTHCTENSETNDGMEGIEVIDLCSKNQTKKVNSTGKRKHKARKSGQNEKQNNCKDGERKIGLGKVSQRLKVKKMKQR